MKIFIISLLLGLSSGRDFSRVGVQYDCENCQPEQVHIAFGEKVNDIVITWSTFDDTLMSIVEYGEGVMDNQTIGSSKIFVDGGRRKRSQYIHTVTLTDLKFNTSYVYHVGSVYGWSEEFWFRTVPAGEAWPVRAAIYGDMGSDNAQSLSYLQEEAQRSHFDVILHVGDFAYDMDSKNARVGDEFMRQIEPLATIVPYIVARMTNCPISVLSFVQEKCFAVMTFLTMIKV